jgi:hypothetical protein
MIKSEQWQFFGGTTHVYKTNLLGLVGASSHQGHKYPVHHMK